MAELSAANLPVRSEVNPTEIALTTVGSENEILLTAGRATGTRKEEDDATEKGAVVEYVLSLSSLFLTKKKYLVPELIPVNAEIGKVFIIPRCKVV
jgi:hypothetical protein